MAAAATAIATAKPIKRPVRKFSAKNLRMSYLASLERVPFDLTHKSATHSVCSPPPCGEGVGVGVVLVRRESYVTARPPPRRHSAPKTRVNALKAPTLPTRGRVKTEFAARA